MINEIANALGCQADDLIMKPNGFCRTSDKLWLIADLDGNGLVADGSDIIRDYLNDRGYDYATDRYNEQILRSLNLIPFTCNGRHYCLDPMPMEHLEEFRPDEL